MQALTPIESPSMLIEDTSMLLLNFLKANFKSFRSIASAFVRFMTTPAGDALSRCAEVGAPQFSHFWLHCAKPNISATSKNTVVFQLPVTAFNILFMRILYTDREALLHPQMPTSNPPARPRAHVESTHFSMSPQDLIQPLSP